MKNVASCSRKILVCNVRDFSEKALLCSQNLGFYLLTVFGFVSGAINGLLP